jgi:PhzF family phenazine biosynthesis protein
MRVRIIDAFADRAFAGNPAAVCQLDGDGWPQTAWMQSVAAELGLPMTAFVRRVAQGGEADWALRWFTPMIEEKLCGHATLATAHALQVDAGRPISVRFATLSGVLPVQACADGTVTLDFPAAAVIEAPMPEGLPEALGLASGEAYRAAGLGDLIVVVDDERAVRELAPDFAAVELLTQRDRIRGVVATAPAAAGDYDFVSRFFSPADGVPEDPVTGSAHTALAPYWAARLGREELTGFQASARGGVVKASLHGDRVHIAGRAVTVLDGAWVG